MKAPSRTGTVSFGDASLSVWEEPGRPLIHGDGWEQAFKHDVFARIVQTLNRLGWSCVLSPIDECKVKAYGGNVERRGRERRRFCTKGDLKADLSLSGRHIEFQMFQSINCPTRPDYEGRYESSKEACMSYLQRLEMEHTRRRIRDYLCNVFDGYSFQLAKISSPNPDPLAYFNGIWGGSDRFDRDPSGWPSERALGSWSRTDQDGVRLEHGSIRYTRDSKGRLRRGRVYGGINGMWMLVYGPGRNDYVHETASTYFAYVPGMPRKQVSAHRRQQRLQGELDKAVKAMNFERAAVLRDILHPKAVRHG
ncbi:UvrB/UvrC motif-containing protein [Stenotrophomonas acidaminiphila]|uniref:UvrB/UvrC motif-containing protein n=1 Tax=Stenotrophomonas acidaminiphila TaxID=128780 RepID=UPI001FB02B37|nr:UvrB/UvrC motif-containing protein [Stenotrophomonas acidaminiphila]